MAGRLEEAKRLWRANSQTLGFFPDGAFSEHAQNRWILYLLEGERVIGYLLYRIAKDRIVIAHLCVDASARRNGSAKCLFRALVEKEDRGLYMGVEVRCRRDYGLSGLWEKLGFNICNTKIGRGSDGAELNIWYYKLDGYGFLDKLFGRAGDDEFVWAVLDSNIVFSLKDCDRSNDEELKALLSDSVYSYSKYVVAPVINNEIDRRSDDNSRNESRRYIESYRKIDPDRSAIDKYKALLDAVWKDCRSDQDHSDMMHVVYAAAAGISYLITRDGGILNQRNAIHDCCGVTVVRPVEYVAEIYRFEDDERYDVRSIARSKVHQKRLGAQDIDIMVETFLSAAKGERKGNLTQLLRNAIANKPEYDVIAYFSDSVPAALYVGRRIDDVIEIAVLRCQDTRQGKALVQNLLWGRFSRVALDAQCGFKLTDPYARSEISLALSSLGFVQRGASWVRIVCNKVTACRSIAAELPVLLPELTAIGSPGDCGSSLTCADVSNIEVALWPLKIADSPVCTYLIPIQPYWAMQLFDEGIANEFLTGTDVNRFFSLENVYYSKRLPRTTPVAPRASIGEEKA